MARQFNLNDPTWGEMPVYVIRVRSDGSWEKQWEPIRVDEACQSIVELVEPVSSKAFESALSGWASPMIDELGLPPEACFAKVAEEISKCHYRDDCLAWDESKCFASESAPPCFSLDVADVETRRLVNRIFEMWRNGIRVCRVPYEMERGDDGR